MRMGALAFFGGGVAFEAERVWHFWNFWNF